MLRIAGPGSRASRLEVMGVAAGPRRRADSYLCSSWACRIGILNKVVLTGETVMSHKNGMIDLEVAYDVTKAFV